MIDGVSVILGKFMFISPKVMFTAKIPSFHLVPTKTTFVFIGWLVKTFNNIVYCFWRIPIFSFIPHYLMAFFHVFGMGFKKLKIFNSIVSFNPISMMNPFILGKFSTKKFFHNMTMLKNPFSVYIYAQISKFSKCWLSLFKIRPFGRNIITPMPMPSTPMGLANLSRCFIEYISTIFNSTCLTISHNCIIAGWVKHVK